MSAEKTPGSGDECLTRHEYPMPIHALEDALRVVRRLRDVTSERTLVTSDDIDFLTRRAEQLITSCIRFEAQQVTR